VDHCDECGFDYEALAVADISDALRGFGRRYRPPLTRFLAGEDGDALIRRHPQPDVWSALEYTCHVRDVFAVQRGRMQRALVEDDFVPELMRRDERVVEMAYNEQDSAAVLAELDANGAALADDLAAFGDAQWDRTMTYPWPEPAVRDLRWVGRHTVHEGHHHLLDIGRVLRSARGR
jgi:hypothetical protein